MPSLPSSLHDQRCPGLGPTDPACFLAALLCSLHCPLWLQPPSSAPSQEHFNCMSHLAHEKTNTLCEAKVFKEFSALTLSTPPSTAKAAVIRAPRAVHSATALWAALSRGWLSPQQQAHVQLFLHFAIRTYIWEHLSLRVSGNGAAAYWLSQDHWHHPYCPPPPAPFSRPSSPLSTTTTAQSNSIPCWHCSSIHFQPALLRHTCLRALNGLPVHQDQVQIPCHGR